MMICFPSSPRQKGRLRPPSRWDAPLRCGTMLQTLERCKLIPEIEVTSQHCDLRSIGAGDSLIVQHTTIDLSASGRDIPKGGALQPEVEVGSQHQDLCVGE